MNKNIEIFYTGGGIWMAEVDVNENEYAAVSSEAPEYLTIYEKVEGEEKYFPEDMILAQKSDELSPELKELHGELLKALKEKVEV